MQSTKKLQMNPEQAAEFVTQDGFETDMNGVLFQKASAAAVVEHMRPILEEGKYCITVEAPHTSFLLQRGWRLEDNLNDLRCCGQMAVEWGVFPAIE